MTEMQPLVDLQRVTKDYRGVPAVKEVDFSVLPGEIHALLGENGAGKSTLVKMIAGVIAPTSGAMLLDGAPASFRTPSEALARGIAMVFQEPSLVPSMSVAQNLWSDGLCRASCTSAEAATLARRARNC